MPKRKKRISLKEHRHLACVIGEDGQKHCGTLLGESIERDSFSGSAAGVYAYVFDDQRGPMWATRVPSGDSDDWGLKAYGTPAEVALPLTGAQLKRFKQDMRGQRREVLTERVGRVLEGFSGAEDEVDTYDGYPSIDVKVRTVKGLDDYDEDVREMAWDQAVEMFWTDAQEYAETVFKGRKPVVESAGRSGGHLIVRGIGVPEDWDSEDLDRWEDFEKTIKDTVQDYRTHHIAEIAADIAEQE